MDDDDVPPCTDCGEASDYVEPDSGLCDLCTAIQRALEDTVALEKLRAEIEPRH